MAAADHGFAIRGASPEDVGAAGPLSLEPPGGLNSMIPDTDVRLRIARAAFRARGTAFSFERTLVAERGGRVVALISSFPGSAWARIRLRTGLVMLGAAGIRWGPRLVRLGRLEDRAMLPVPDDVLYVMSLAVDPSWRRQGIARELLERAVEEAGRARLRALALDVAPSNVGAIALYRRVSFSEIAPPNCPAHLGAGPSLLRMERPIRLPHASHTDPG